MVSRWYGPALVGGASIVAVLMVPLAGPAQAQYGCSQPTAKTGIRACITVSGTTVSGEGRRADGIDPAKSPQVVIVNESGSPQATGTQKASKVGLPPGRYRAEFSYGGDKQVSGWVQVTTATTTYPTTTVVIPTAPGVTVRPNGPTVSKPSVASPAPKAPSQPKLPPAPRK